MMEIGPQLKDLLEMLLGLTFTAFFWWLMFRRKD